MLEYFGFYATRTPEPHAEPQALPEEEAVARASRLADRVRHTQPAPAAGRAWESSTAMTR